jgi:phosphatidylethanolamine-binding protein (PEBP) family uncharacterized protein
MQTRLLILFSAALTVAACTTWPAPVADTATTPGESRAFTLSSPGRSDNEMLTRPYAGKNSTNPNCVGENLSPALSWVRPPAGTQSFAIVMDDQTGRAGLGVNHWTAYGIRQP